MLCGKVLCTFLNRNVLVCSRALHVVQDNSGNVKYLSVKSNYNHCLPSNDHLNLYVTRRFKHKKIASRDEDNEEEEEEEEDENKTKKSNRSKFVNVHSLRADLIIKSVLGIARNKVDELFYDGKIRINNEKIIKKSVEVNIGDEVDVIQGYSDEESKFLRVTRFAILSLHNVKEGYRLEIHKDGSLVIENYDNPWRP